MPKLVILTSDDWYFLSHRLPMASAAKSMGMDVVVVTSGGPRVSEIEELGYRHIQLDAMSRMHKGLLKSLRLAFVLRGFLNKEKPDLVLNVGLRLAVLATVGNFPRNRPEIINLIAGLGYLFTSNRLHARILGPFIKFVMRFIFRRRNVHLITQNRDNFEFFHCDIVGHDRRLTLIAGSGVDPDRFKPVNQPETPLIVTLAGRMIWSKGIREFVGAAKILKKMYPDIRMVLVGVPDAANRESIPVETLRKWDNDSLIEWWGFEPNIAETWNRTSISVVPTWYGEGIPKVLLEAGACARPVIASNISGCNDVIEDGVNGILIPSRSVQAIVDAVSRLVESPEEREAMGARLRETVRDNHSNAITHQATKELLEKITAEMAETP